LQHAGIAQIFQAAIKILDFGVARSTDSDLQVTNLPGYASMGSRRSW
jgi:hypothetical protein